MEALGALVDPKFREQPRPQSREGPVGSQSRAGHIHGNVERQPAIGQYHDAVGEEDGFIHIVGDQ